jgi:transposase-like protein
MPGVECLPQREASEARHPFLPMMNCPSCSSSHTRVIETRTLHNGGRRRRHHCHFCQHRWTTWLGERPPQGRVPNARPGRRTQPPLTEEQVRLVLTSPLSSGKLARELGRSKEAINGIRRGAFHAKTLPELPRRQAKRRAIPELSCHACAHWRSSECGMGFPDPIEEGPAFAADCSLYEPSTQSINRA